MVELDPETATASLRERGIVAPDATVEARPLGGGVSNRVVRVAWDEGCLVLKQPLPNLAVEDDWPADVERVHNEADATRAARAIVEEAGLDDVRVPGVMLEERDDHVIAVECAPAAAETWKRELLAGTVDAGIARSVGRALGAVHRLAADDEALRDGFASKRPFEQLRIDPYHLTTAERHPEVAAAIREEARRVLSVDRTLVHGDYSPKNVLLDRTGDAPAAWLIDFEVAHWGDPAFDVGFMLNHLFIKSVYNHERGSAYVDAARAFHAAYQEEVPWDGEGDAVAELAVLMLARVDGKSPVEYVGEGPIAEALRRIAKRALAEEIRRLEGFAAVAGEERDRL